MGGEQKLNKNNKKTLNVRTHNSFETYKNNENSNSNTNNQNENRSEEIAVDFDFGKQPKNNNRQSKSNE